MAVTYLESFGWSSSAGGNPFLDREYVVAWGGGASTSQTLQRPGSSGCMVLGQAISNTRNIQFPVRTTPTCTLGFSIGYITTDNGNHSIQINLNGNFIRMRQTYIEYTLGGVYGTHSWNVQSSFAYVELQITPTLIIFRINNNEITRRAGSGFSAGTDFFRVVSHDYPNGCRFGDFYLTDDATFRGDCYVRLMPLTDTVLNTGEKQGPAANLADALKVFSGTDFVIYDQSLEATTMELGDITDNPSNIHGVLVRYSTAKTQTDNVTAVPYVETTAGQSNLPSHQPGGSYAPRYHTLPVDPTDGGSWTKAKVNSLRIGIRRQD